MSDNDQRLTASVAAAARTVEVMHSTAKSAADYVASIVGMTAGGENQVSTRLEAKHTSWELKEDQTETDAWALLDTFDNRLTEAERRIDRVLARLNVE